MKNKNKNKQIEDFVKGVSGAAITGAIELVKRIKKMDKNRFTLLIHLNNKQAVAFCTACFVYRYIIYW